MSRRLLILIALLALAVSALSPVAAGAAQSDATPVATDVVESTTGSYIVVMEADPLVATEGQDALASRNARVKGAALTAGHSAVLEEAGVGAEAKVQSFTNALNGFSAIMSYEEAKKVAGQKGVLRVLPDELRQLETDSSPRFLGLTKGGEAWRSGVTGEGVVVGVIDSGIWPEHPSFADDGSYAAPPVGPIACEFGNTAHNEHDVAFKCNNKLVGARQMLATYRQLSGVAEDEFDSARDDDGHGTHTASTAAGNAGVEASMFDEDYGTISGIAPRAHVIAYKGLGNLGGYGSDLAAAIDQAVLDGVDVINYSVGGGPSLTGADDIAFLYAANAGVWVATSAGNSGAGAATVGGPGSVPWITTVGASTQTRFFEGEVKIESDDDDDDDDDLESANGRRRRKGDDIEVKGASVTSGTDDKLAVVDAEFAGGDLCVPGTLEAGVVEGKIVLCRRGAIARAEKSLAVYQAGGAGMILYNNTDDDNLFTDSHWVPSVHIDNTPGVEIKQYIADHPNAEAEIETGDTSKWKNAPTMAIFSSRGWNPVAEDIIKPDITAPGVQILAGGSPFPDPLSTPPGELFQAISGTSMSSPHIAGIFALIKQVNPDWTAAMAKSAIMTTAHQKVRDNDRVSPADPFDMGAGHVDPGKVRNRGSAFNPGLVYDAGFFEYLGFLCDAEPSALGPKTCPSLEVDGVPTDASDLNLASIGVAELAGSQTITRTVTSVADKKVKWKVKVDAPDGYDVTVSPNKLTLNPGDTATYEVTITNNGGGPIGEWRFGSLEWKGGGYEAYSPIAVKGALFNAPAEVGGSGPSGSGSFDVLFGYSGDYAAAGHGLEAETVTSGVVPQDPDQTFDPTDGFSDAIEFDLTDAAHFRIVMGPDDTEAGTDIDIFVFDPTGTQVASSTSGGTDEQIDISLPAAGTWTVYIHGWLTTGPDSDYDLSSWIIPTASGGSLSVDGAPTSATVGETGTVDYSWSGLTVETHYLGAVSHSDAGGIIGLTLVDVTG